MLLLCVCREAESAALCPARSTLLRSTLLQAVPCIMDVRKGTPTYAGVHEQLASCVQQLWVWLTVKDGLSLFHTSKQLAKQVVRSSPHVTLQFSQETPGEAVGTRRSIISQLLDTGCKIRLVLGARGPQPFPVALSSQVTDVCLQYTQEGPASPWLEWSQFTGLQKLHLRNMITPADIDKLCSVLVEGHLPQLQELQHFVRTHYLTYEAFTRALGVRVKDLSTNCSSLMNHVHHLAALENICLSGGCVTLDVLCDHPTLKNVQLTWWQSTYPDCSDRHCDWRSLHLLGTQRPSVLLRLPLANLQTIRITRRISVYHTEFDLQAIRLLINRYLEKVELLPQWDDYFKSQCFKVECFTTETIPIVSRLCTDCCLVVQRSSKDPAFLPALWAALHPSVSTLQLQGMRGVDWRNFWTGIPPSVLNVALSWDDFSSSGGVSALTADVLCHLITSIPVHVKRLELDRQWKAACDKLVAPAHVTLVFP